MEEKFIISEIKKYKDNPKSVFEWIDFLGLDKESSKEFIRTVDKLLESYQIILKGDKLYLGEWDGYYCGSIRVNHRGFGFIDFEESPSTTMIRLLSNYCQMAMKEKLLKYWKET